MSDLKKDKVEVIGVSMDNAESHQKFVAKYNLNVRLLTNSEGKITNAFGARMAHRNLSHRLSFLVGLDGKIVHVTDNPAAMHLSEMKDAIARLRRGSSTFRSSAG